MEINVSFIYLTKIIKVKCKDDEDINEMYAKFTNELNDDSQPTHYIYYFDGKKLGNKGIIRKDKYLRDKEDITITVQKKLRIVKCPECICNDCIVNLDNNQLTFYGCKYKHINARRYDDYITEQRIIGPELKCSAVGCDRNQQNYFKGFYKCFGCSTVEDIHESNRGGGSQYYCKDHIEDEEHEGHFFAKYDKKSYYCGKHSKAYSNYCFTHKKDLCDDCLNHHIDCKVRDYNLMDPNIKQLKENLNLMEKNINILRIKIENITRHLLDALRVFKRYHYIAKDIIGKYELFNNELKNYRILKSLRNLKATNIKMNKELTDVITEQDTFKKINSLFKIAETQEGISRNGEKFDYSKDNDDDWLEEITKNEKIKSSTQRPESEKSKKPK
jgi:hypothetical protein